MHDGLESLYKCIPKEFLPKDYGGDDKTMEDLHGRLIIKYPSHLNIHFLYKLHTHTTFLD